MNEYHELPQPDVTSLDRSKQLTQVVNNAIYREGGRLSFASYMDMALYEPKLGYYQNDQMMLGQQGDFTTAPEISPVFGKCLARQCAQILQLISDGSILELGAGSGVLARDLLKELGELKCLPEKYLIYEISESLIHQQKEFLRTAIPDYFDKFVWLNEIPTSFKGVVIANEVLDALPVHRVFFDNGQFYEWSVGYENNFITKLGNCTSDLFAEQAEKISIELNISEPYLTELHLNCIQYVNELAQCLKAGALLFIDYGYGQTEYYTPLRDQGTLTCFYKHYRHDNPFIYPGLQDITAHVNFTAVVETAVEAELSLGGYTTQAAFLLACDLEGVSQQHAEKMSTAEQYQLQQAVKRLTLPSEMGERIKVMALTKNIETHLVGFTLLNKIRDL